MTKEAVLVGHDYEIRDPRVQFGTRIIVHTYYGDEPAVQYFYTDDGSDGSNHWLFRHMFLDRYIHASDCCLCRRVRERPLKPLKKLSKTEQLEFHNAISTLFRLLKIWLRRRSSWKIFLI